MAVDDLKKQMTEDDLKKQIAEDDLEETNDRGWPGRNK